MPFTIKFIKNCDFVATSQFDGTIDEAASFAADAMTENHADLAAILDVADLNGAPRLVSATA